MVRLGVRYVLTNERRLRRVAAEDAVTVRVAGTRPLIYKLLMNEGFTASFGFTSVVIAFCAFQKSAAAFTLV
jgi:hypothetical protein